VAWPVGFYGPGRWRRAVTRGSGARARAPAEAGQRLVAAAGSSALGVHAEPLRGLHVAGGQRVDRPERIDGSGPSVSCDPPSAHPAHRRRERATGYDHRRQTSCPYLVHWGAVGIWTTPRSASCGQPPPWAATPSSPPPTPNTSKRV